MTMTTPDPQKLLDAWEQAANAVKTMQNAVSQNTPPQKDAAELDHVRHLILSLLAAVELPAPKESLSVIYRGYGDQESVLIFYQGAAYDQNNHGDEPSLFALNNKALDKIVSNPDSQALYCPNRTSCEQQEFQHPDLGSVLIVPMALHEHKNLGAFVLHAKQEHAFDGLVNIMDAVSDRMAHLIRQVIWRVRGQSFHSLQNQLIQKSFDSETELLQAVGKAVKAWFSHDRFYIIMRHSLNTKTFFVAYDSASNEQTPDFRVTQPKIAQELTHIWGQHALENTTIRKEACLLNNAGSITNTLGSTIEHCQSWLAAPMRIESGTSATTLNLGYFVLHNAASHAYENVDQTFIGNISDFTALLYTNFRQQQKRALKNRLLGEVLNRIDFEPKEAYKEVKAALEKLYGPLSVAIGRVDHANLRFSIEEEISFPVSDPLKQAFAEKLEFIKTGERKVGGDSPKLVISAYLLEWQEQQFIVTPMRVNRRYIGCFIIAADYPGKYTVQIIDEISDVLAIKVDNWEKHRLRQELSDKLAREFSDLDPKNLTQQTILEKTYDTIKEALFSDNFYVALYDKKTEMISFPLMYVGGTLHQQPSREMNLSKRGKTEEIIHTRQHLFHRTKADAEKWYAETGRGEYLGNTLASWMGVPILAPAGGVLGVLAVYHDTEDYVYAREDVGFLRNIAYQISALFRAAKLQEAIQNNTELKQAQQKIAEQQHILSTSLLAQDLTHRMHNSIGALSININQAISDIQEAKETGDTSFFKFTMESLEDSREMINNLLKSVHEVSDDSQNNVNLSELLKKIARQVWIAQRLAEYDIDLRLTNDENKEFFITAHHRTLFNALYAIVDNAAYALLQYKSQHSPLYLDIHIHSIAQQIVITFADNGLPINSEVEEKLFEYGQSDKNSSGFGLWRARSIIQNLGGEIQFQKKDDEKIFTVTLPNTHNVNTPSRLALILDDERSWRGILSRWLSEEGYDTKLASNPAEMQELIQLTQEEGQQPAYVFLDISMNETDGANAEGLTLISHVKDHFPSGKVIIVTGYAKLAKAYQGQYDRLISKVSENGDVLNKELLFELIKS